MRKPTPRTYAVTTMYVGMGATLAGNAATANWTNLIDVVISAFPALALFLTFEMVMRARPNPSRTKPHHHAMRLIPAVGIMLGSAYVSVGHLLELAQTHGQSGTSAWVVALLPDAMMMLAAVVIKDSPAPAARKTPAARKRTSKAAARKPNPITAAAPQPNVRRTRGNAAAAPAVA